MWIIFFNEKKIYGEIRNKSKDVILFVPGKNNKQTLLVSQNNNKSNGKNILKHEEVGHLLWSSTPEASKLIGT